MKKKCYSLGQRLIFFLANCLVIYKLILFWDIPIFSFWHLCKRQGECIHIKMFTFNGKTTHNGSLHWTHFQVFVQSSEYCISSFYWRREPFQATHPFSFKQEKWNDQYLPLLQASTQKPGCSSYMWQVLMLPKLQSFFGYLFLLKYKQVSCLKVPSQGPQQQGQDKATLE